MANWRKPLIKRATLNLSIFISDVVSVWPIAKLASAAS